MNSSASTDAAAAAKAKLETLKAELTEMSADYKAMCEESERVKALLQKMNMTLLGRESELAKLRCNVAEAETAFANAKCREEASTADRAMLIKMLQSAETRKQLTEILDRLESLGPVDLNAPIYDGLTLLGWFLHCYVDPRDNLRDRLDLIDCLTKRGVDLLCIPDGIKQLCALIDFAHYAKDIYTQDHVEIILGFQTVLSSFFASHRDKGTLHTVIEPLMDYLGKVHSYDALVHTRWNPGYATIPMCTRRSRTIICSMFRDLLSSPHIDPSIKTSLQKMFTPFDTLYKTC
jgi:hypothetical protein